ncbi:zeta toxin family protein [Tomitella biformata]|uniref:zeta toxin family protein n=1 Tax=Tomitella biformata TaxID=630403 RepID=UPI000467DC3A|nr:zeta toxin family protein [Tomitella biformata]
MAIDPRAATAAALERMCRPGGVLDQNGAAASHRLHADNPHRRRTLDRIIESYLAEQDNVVIGGQFCAIATAGVPGAGKSTSIERNGLAGQGWRVLDADRVKDYLIREALEAGVYRDIVSMGLPDGGTVMARELATLVHTESTKIVDALQELCMGRGENLVIEGTFSWPGLGERLLRHLGAAGYERFTIMDVEVPSERAQEQALGRWWTGRTGGDELGGRFTPASVIAGLYPAGSAESICATNARAAFEHPLAAQIDAVELWVDDYTSGVLVEKVSTRHKGIISYEPDVAASES